MSARHLITAAALVAALLAPCAPMLAAAPAVVAGLDPYEAIVTKAVRQVEWQRARTSRWQKARLETLLVVGDTLRTGAESTAELAYGDGSVTRVGSLTSLTLTGEKKRELRLDGGRVWLHIQKGGAGMRVITPGAVAAVTGTELMVEFDPVRKLTEVTVFEGAVNVTGDVGELVKVIGGTTTRVPFHAPAVAPAPLDERKLQDRDNLFKPLSIKEPANGQDPNGQTSSGETKGSDSGKPNENKGQSGENQAEPAAATNIEQGSATPPPAAPSPSVAATPAPAASAGAPDPKAVSPDLKGQVKGLNDPRLINGSPTTGTVRVIIE